ncbi:hypothetical protein [Roseivivax sediminis]|uniref:hypothetical protein n=1 Tax=Roseivivax sediminis TaxID=936889 RepID=UPI00165FB659|nr:hypothetical protein [Roseivivax sediminis]
MLETEGRDLAAEPTTAGHKAAFWAVDVRGEAKFVTGAEIVIDGGYTARMTCA